MVVQQNAAADSAEAGVEAQMQAAADQPGTSDVHEILRLSEAVVGDGVIGERKICSFVWSTCRSIGRLLLHVLGVMFYMATLLCNTCPVLSVK